MLWDEVEQSVLQELVESMARRLLSMEERRIGATPY